MKNKVLSTINISKDEIRFGGAHGICIYVYLFVFICICIYIYLYFYLILYK